MTEQKLLAQQVATWKTEISRLTQLVKAASADSGDEPTAAISFTFSELEILVRGAESVSWAEPENEAEWDGACAKILDAYKVLLMQTEEVEIQQTAVAAPSGSSRSLLSRLSSVQMTALNAWRRDQVPANGIIDLMGWPGWSDAVVVDPKGDSFFARQIASVSKVFERPAVIPEIHYTGTAKGKVVSMQPLLENAEAGAQGSLNSLDRQHQAQSEDDHGKS